MNIDNLDARQHTSLLKVSTKLKQSQSRFVELMNHSDVSRWSSSDNMHVNKRLLKPIKSYSPIKNDDMCLSDLLKYYPKYRYNYNGI